MRADIIPGARFPDYELTDHTRQRRSLSELQGDHPMVLVLSRGHFCPKDHHDAGVARRVGRGRPFGVLPVWSGGGA